MNFNVCLVQPDGYQHSLAFLELGELLHYSLKDLGYGSQLQFNKIDGSARNVIIGCHLLGPQYIAQMPSSSIILNTEQIYADSFDKGSSVFEWVKHFQVWDYSRRNMKTLQQLGVEDARLLKLGFQKELVRIPKAAAPDIDVLFYGSINPRRLKILTDLRDRGANVHSVFGSYGAERDALIGRSKLVLNHHFHDAQIFEVVRVSYLMANAVAVVGEVNAATSIDAEFVNGIEAAPYERLVLSCERLLNDAALRTELQQRAFNAVSTLPQKDYTAQALA